MCFRVHSSWGDASTVWRLSFGGLLVNRRICMSALVSKNGNGALEAAGLEMRQQWKVDFEGQQQERRISLGSGVGGKLQVKMDEWKIIRY